LVYSDEATRWARNGSGRERGRFIDPSPGRLGDLRPGFCFGNRVSSPRSATRNPVSKPDTGFQDTLIPGPAGAGHSHLVLHLGHRLRWIMLSSWWRTLVMKRMTRAARAGRAQLRAEALETRDTPAGTFAATAGAGSAP